MSTLRLLYHLTRIYIALCVLAVINPSHIPPLLEKIGRRAEDVRKGEMMRAWEDAERAE